MKVSVLRNPLFSGSSLLIGGSVVAGAVNYLFNVVMARESFLGPEGFGTLTALSAFLYLDGVATAALATSTAYAVAAAAGANDAGVGSVLWWVLRWTARVALAAALALLLLSPWLAGFLHLASPAPIVAVAPVLVVTLLAGVLSGGLQGTLLFASLAAVAVVGAVLRLLFAIVFVRGGFGVTGVIAAGFFATALAALFAVRVLRSPLARARGRAAPAGFSPRTFLASGGPTALSFLGLTLLFTLDTVLAKHYLSAQDAGVYGAISTLGRVVYFAALPITLVMFPLLTRRLAAGEKFRAILLASGGGIVLLGALVAGAYAAFPAPILHVTFGAVYAAGAPLLALGALFFAAVSVATWVSHVALAFRSYGLAVLPVGAAVLEGTLMVRLHGSVRALLLAALAATGLLVLVQGVLVGRRILRHRFVPAEIPEEGGS